MIQLTVSISFVKALFFFSQTFEIDTLHVVRSFEGYSR